MVFPLPLFLRGRTTSLHEPTPESKDIPFTFRRGFVKRSKPLVDVVGIQPIIDVVALALETAFVKDDVDGYRPASLLLIAKPESGKTTTITKFSRLPFIYFTNEVTVKTLVDKVFKSIETKEVRFILVPDILNCVKKSTYTREPLLQTLKSLVDEGVVCIQTPYKDYSYRSPIKAGLITAITRSELYAHPRRYSLYSDLQRMGFLSRMIPFSYEYPIDKVVKIFEYIQSGKAEGYNVTIPKLRTFRKERKFQPDKELFKYLEIISRNLASYSDSYGLRVQKNLQKLCYANALMNKRDCVTREDVDRVLYLGRWMNFDFNSL